MFELRSLKWSTAMSAIAELAFQKALSSHAPPAPRSVDMGMKRASSMYLSKPSQPSPSGLMLTGGVVVPSLKTKPEASQPVTESHVPLASIERSPVVSSATTLAST